MELEPGRQLLHYRLIDKIGQGGMGVVWRATDTTLDREVAIKVLPDDFALEAERLTRFEREARLLASLNHPHIAGIYGIHETEGKRFLSMELVPGEDLSALLDRGPLPLDRVLRIAREVAEALEAAHESGVIHRDLKPANVRLTADGKAKVLDFGLAKAYDPATASDPMRSATVTSAGTVAGLILGTAAYMSPEQASGQPTDRRCDIWSFGVMLHEMLSNKRLFEGETISHTLADVLRAPIDLDDLPSTTPRPVRRLIERCLERDKMRRLRDIGEARIVLEDAIASPDEDGERTERAEAPVRKPSRVPWIVSGLAVITAAIAFIWSLGGTGAPPEPTRRFSLDIPRSGFTRQGDGMAVAISSDGGSVITMAGAGADQMLYLRSVGSFEARALEGTAGGRNPFFSPDDRWIGFLWAMDLRKIRVTGGPSVLISRAPSAPDGVDWGDDDSIYYASQGAIWRVPADGGDVEQLSSEDARDLRLQLPHVLPGARTVLCNTGAAPGRVGQLMALDIDSGKLKDLEMPGTDARYLPTGHLLFAQLDRVFIAPFDLARLRFTGPPLPVHPRAWVDSGQIQLVVSDEGTVIYQPATRDETQALVSVGLDGHVEPLVPDSLPFMSLGDPRISRDGKRLLLSVEGGAIWMVDLETRTPTLMSESGFYPLWSPDGSEIIYSTTRAESFDIYRRPVDLSREEKLFMDVENNLRTMDWTRQGQLVVREEIPDKGMDLRWLSDVDDPSTFAPLLEGPDDELAPIISNDGKWMAFVSNYSGSDEIYVTGFPRTGARIQISTRGGNSPTWAPDGSAIYYFEGNRMIEVAVETEPTFRVVGRRNLFEGNYVQYRWSRQYDIHPDGKRFILVKSPARGNLEVVTNWFEELDSSGR